ncbi:MAG: imidazole glycerol phosphate synthase subunit HisH [Nocardioidaceae bacterium]
MSPRVVLFDYGSGNIRSGERALARAGASVEVTSSVDRAVEADGVVIPGVGAFAACMESLLAVGGAEVVERRLGLGRPVLAICVGHQVLFERGDEHGVSTAGLGVWPGAVSRVQAPVLPHVGWNTVDASEAPTMFDGVGDERFYFVHSYAAHHDSPDLDGGAAGRSAGPRGAAWSTYGQDTFVAAVEVGPLWSTQFHPEKSGDAGLALLRNWVSTL